MNGLVSKTVIALPVILSLAGCVTTPPLRQAEIAPPGPMPEQDGGARLDPAKTQQLYLSVISGLRDQDKPRAALAFLDDYGKRYPGDLRAKLMRAQVQAKLKMFEEAKSRFAELDGTEYAAAGHNGLGIILAHEGRWPDAVTAFRRAVAIRPTEAGFIANLGYGLMNMGALEEAEFLLLQARELDPADIAIRTNILLCKYLLGKDAEVAAGIAGFPTERERRQVERLLAEWPSVGMPEPAAEAVRGGVL